MLCWVDFRSSCFWSLVLGWLSNYQLNSSTAGSIRGFTWGMHHLMIIVSVLEMELISSQYPTSGSYSGWKCYAAAQQIFSHYYPQRSLLASSSRIPCFNSCCVAGPGFQKTKHFAWQMFVSSQTFSRHSTKLSLRRRFSLHQWMQI